MTDLIELQLITREDAECLHTMQVEAFMPLYENVICMKSVDLSEPEMKRL